MHLKSIAALTPGYNIPSSRFRIRQHIDRLLQSGIRVKEFPSRLYDNKIPGQLGRVRQRYILPVSLSYEFIKVMLRLPDGIASHFFDATWLNRTFYNAFSLDFILKRPLIFDIDDAIWINDRKKVENLARRSDYIFAGNSFIADWASGLNKNVFLIPTAVDTIVYKPSLQIKEDIFILGWSGTSENQKYLLSIEMSLSRFMNDNPRTKLQILSDRYPKLSQIPVEQIEFIPWDPEIESTVIAGFNVGLMPLDDSDWSKGKCSYKMLQYMASGIPVIVSPVGMNKELLNLGEIGMGATNGNEWIESLEFIFSDPQRSHRMGIEGRFLAEEKYSKTHIGKLITDILISL